MAETYPVKSAITALKFQDATTETPKELDLVAVFDGFPELAEPTIKADPRIVLHNGNFLAVAEEDDSVEFPEAEFSVMMLDTQVSAGVNNILEWFNDFKDGGAALVSTNDGSAKLRDINTKALVTGNVPASLFKTLQLVVTYGSGTGVLTDTYKYVQPISAKVVGKDKDLAITLKIKFIGAKEAVA